MFNAQVSGQEYLRMRVSQTCVVDLTLHGQVTQEAIEALISHLVLCQETYPTDIPAPHEIKEKIDWQMTPQGGG